MDSPINAKPLDHLSYMAAEAPEYPEANCPRDWTFDRYQTASFMLNLYLQVIFSTIQEFFSFLGLSKDFYPLSSMGADTIIELAYKLAAGNWATWQPLLRIHQFPRRCPLGPPLSQWPLSFARVA